MGAAEVARPISPLKFSYPGTDSAPASESASESKSGAVAPVVKDPFKGPSARIEQLLSDVPPTVPATDLDESLKSDDLQTYPKKFLGNWVGTVSIEKNDFGTLKAASPELVKRETAILYNGRVGDTSIEFQKGKMGKSRSAAPTIEFHPTVEDLQYLDLVSKDKPGIAAAKPTTVPKGLRLNIKLGESAASKSLVGGVQGATELSNRIRTFGRTELEQQIVTSANSMYPGANAVRFTTCESVLHFNLLTPATMEVKLALVHYSSEGKLESKIIMRGTLTKKKKTAV